jgi:hypothetical protein
MLSLPRGRTFAPDIQPRMLIRVLLSAAHRPASAGHAATWLPLLGISSQAGGGPRGQWHDTLAKAFGTLAWAHLYPGLTPPQREAPAWQFPSWARQSAERAPTAVVQLAQYLLSAVSATHSAPNRATHLVTYTRRAHGNTVDDNRHAWLHTPPCATCRWAPPPPAPHTTATHPCAARWQSFIETLGKPTPPQGDCPSPPQARGDGPSSNDGAIGMCTPSLTQPRTPRPPREPTGPPSAPPSPPDSESKDGDDDPGKHGDNGSDTGGGGDDGGGDDQHGADSDDGGNGGSGGDDGGGGEGGGSGGGGSGGGGGGEDGGGGGGGGDGEGRGSGGGSGGGGGDGGGGGGGDSGSGRATDSGGSVPTLGDLCEQRLDALPYTYVHDCAVAALHSHWGDQGLRYGLWGILHRHRHEEVRKARGLDSSSGSDDDSEADGILASLPGAEWDWNPLARGAVIITRSPADDNGGGIGSGGGGGGGGGGSGRGSGGGGGDGGSGSGGGSGDGNDDDGNGDERARKRSRGARAGGNGNGGGDNGRGERGGGGEGISLEGPRGPTGPPSAPPSPPDSEAGDDDDGGEAGGDGSGSGGGGDGGEGEDGGGDEGGEAGGGGDGGGGGGGEGGGGGGGGCGGDEGGIDAGVDTRDPIPTAARIGINGRWQTILAPKGEDAYSLLRLVQGGASLSRGAAVAHLAPVRHTFGAMPAITYIPRLAAAAPTRAGPSHEAPVDPTVDAVPGTEIHVTDGAGGSAGGGSHASDGVHPRGGGSRLPHVDDHDAAVDPVAEAVHMRLAHNLGGFHRAVQAIPRLARPPLPIVAYLRGRLGREAAHDGFVREPALLVAPRAPRPLLFRCDPIGAKQNGEREAVEVVTRGLLLPKAQLLEDFRKCSATLEEGWEAERGWIANRVVPSEVGLELTFVHLRILSLRVSPCLCTDVHRSRRVVRCVLGGENRRRCRGLRSPIYLRRLARPGPVSRARASAVAAEVRSCTFARLPAAARALAVLRARTGASSNLASRNSFSPAVVSWTYLASA